MQSSGRLTGFEEDHRLPRVTQKHIFAHNNALLGYSGGLPDISTTIGFATNVSQASDREKDVMLLQAPIFNINSKLQFTSR